MIWRFDGKLARVNCYANRAFDFERSVARRKLFKSGELCVEKWLFCNLYLKVGDCAVCAWRPGEPDRARLAIEVAYNTYGSLKAKQEAREIVRQGVK